jgi:hypothetical protein
MEEIKTRAQDFLNIFVEGTEPVENALNHYEKMDLVLNYFLMLFIRESKRICPDGARIRLLEFAKTYPQVSQLLQKPPKDAMIKWFQETYNIKDFKTSEDFITTLVEKLEG